MWNLVDSNKIIGIQRKIDAFKLHKNKLRRMKSNVKIDQPWKPTFSLSRFRNRYQKTSETQIQKENKSLLERIIKIESEPMILTLNNVPESIPSNPKTYASIKCRERQKQDDERNRENQKIFRKIQTANSDYNFQTLRSNWKSVSRYRENITKKQAIPDFLLLSKEYSAIIKPKARPLTAKPY